MPYQDGLFNKLNAVTVLDQNTVHTQISQELFEGLHRISDTLLKTSANRQHFLSKKKKKSRFQRKDLQNNSETDLGSESDIPSDEETGSEAEFKPVNDQHNLEVLSDESDLDDDADTESNTEQHTKRSPLLLYLEQHEPYLKQTIQKAFIPTYLTNPPDKIDESRQSWLNKMKAEIKDHLIKSYQAHLNNVQSADPYQIVTPINQDDALRAFIYKELAAWQLMIKASLEAANLTQKEIEAYQQDLTILFDQSEYCYLLRRDKANPFVRLWIDLNHGFLYHPWMQNCFDSEKDVLPLNLAPYEWFDTVKQRISLLKVTERLFGVQTVYLLETLFYTMDNAEPPFWLLFLKDGVFFWLNFVLQTIDSTIFALGAIITSHDIGSRRWLKVIFALTFWLCALLPILGIAPAFFKFTAILAGMLKSLLDMRYYYLKKNQSEFKIEAIHFELKAIESKLDIFSKNYFDFLFEQFKLRKQLIKAREKAKQANYRIRDKSVALFASSLALLAMLMAAFLPITVIAISWMICSLFIITTAIKFFYRAATYNTHVEFGLVEAGKTHETCLAEVDDIKKEPSLKSQFHLFNGKDEHYQQAKKILNKLRDKKCLKIYDTESVLHKLFFGTKSDFSKPEKTLALIESAFEFDLELFKPLAIYRQLKTLATLKSEEAFYKRTANQNGIRETQKKITDLRLNLMEQSADLQTCLKEIYLIAKILNAKHYFACRLFLMALFHEIEDVVPKKNVAKNTDESKPYTKNKLNRFFKYRPQKIEIAEVRFFSNHFSP